ncbi:MAG: hypothetical protein M0Z61_04145 [Nitrospiraceae bacterium]|nr:hypothetical protein [Nitrospiraceae bacterium]
MKAYLFRAALLCAVLISACAMGPRLRTGPAGQIPIHQRGDLVLYGGRYSEDLYTVAIFVLNESPYRIVPYAPKFDYRVIKDVGAPEAMDMAVRFFRATNPNFLGTTRQVRVLAPDGKIIGYEIRPLYQPFVYGFSDVLETNYWVKAKGVVNVLIEIPADLRPERRGGDNEPSESGR